MILGLDISTSVIGITLLENDGLLKEMKYYKFKKGTDLFIKLDEFIAYWNMEYDIKHIFVEEPLKMFKGKFSNANTIQTLTSFNAMISSYLYLKYGVIPTYFNASHARTIVFPSLKIPQSHPNKKFLIWEQVNKIEKLKPEYNKSGNLKEENFDMSDSYVIAKMGFKSLLT